MIRIALQEVAEDGLLMSWSRSLRVFGDMRRDGNKWEVLLC